MPFRPKAILQEAKAAEKQGKKRTASSLYAQLAGYFLTHQRFKEAKAVLKRSIQLSYNSPKLYIHLGICEVGLENIAKAQRAIQHFSRYVIREQKVEKYLPYLERYLKDYPALRQVFYEALLELDRTQGAHFISLAQCYFEQGKDDRAIRSLLDALQTKTVDEQALSLLKSIIERKGDRTSVEKLARFEAGKLSREDLILLLSERGGAVSNGLRKFNEEEEEKNLGTLISELESEMGWDAESRYDNVYPLVEEFRRRADTILAGDSKARIDLALAFFEMNLNDAARAELSEVASTDPLYLQAQCIMAEMLMKDGSDLGALEIYQKCLRDSRATEEIQNDAHFRLIQIYMRLGDRARALEQAKLLELRAPEYRDLKSLKRQLDEGLHPEPTRRHSQRAESNDTIVGRSSVRRAAKK